MNKTEWRILVDNIQKRKAHPLINMGLLACDRKNNIVWEKMDTIKERAKKLKKKYKNRYWLKPPGFEIDDNNEYIFSTEKKNK